MGFSVLTMAFQVRRPSVALRSSCFIYSIFTCLCALLLYWLSWSNWPSCSTEEESEALSERTRTSSSCTLHRKWQAQTRLQSSQTHHRPRAVKAGAHWRTYGTLSSIPHLYTCSQRTVCSHKITTTRDQFLFVFLCLSVWAYVHVKHLDKAPAVILVRVLGPCWNTMAVNNLGKKGFISSCTSQDRNSKWEPGGTNWSRGHGRILVTG